MTAILHQAEEPLPLLLTVDTSLLVAAINDRDPGHGVAWALYQRLVSEQVIVAYCSHLLTIEFHNATKRLAGGLRAAEVDALVQQARDRLTGQIALFRRLRACPTDEVDKRAYFMAFADQLLGQYLESLSTVRVRLSFDLLDVAVRDMAEHALDSGDAIVVATARRVSAGLALAPHVATLDTDFLKVSGLHVWGQP